MSDAYLSAARIDPDDDGSGDVLQPAAPERWAFSSRTIQRLIVAGVLFWLSKTEYGPFFDQQLVTDAVAMVSDLLGMVGDNLNEALAGLGTFALGGAARARQIAGPERLYWLPRKRR